MNKYAELIAKADKCEANAMKSESEWGKAFWKSVANRLRDKANDLKICEVI